MNFTLKTLGLSLDAFLQNIITNHAAATEATNPLRNLSREGEELDRSIDELFDTVQVPSGVGKGAMHRENWY